jgi:predicted nucleic acid-binding protein
MLGGMHIGRTMLFSSVNPEESKHAEGEKRSSSCNKMSIKGVIFIDGKLSLDHSITLGSRSLDILHVAAALEFGCDNLITFDQKQERLAKEAGLQTH